MIREATQADIPLLTALIRQSFHDVAERYGLTPATCASHPAFITEANIQEGFEKGGQFWIAEAADTQRRGCVGLVPNRSGVFSLVRLAVLPEYRRHGLGSVLIRQVLAQARRLKLPKVELGIIAAQSDLQRLYEKHGFRVIQTRHFEHLPFEVTLMETQLPETHDPLARHPDAKLVDPALNLQDVFLEMATDYHAAGEDRYDQAMAKMAQSATAGFAAFVEDTLQQASHDKVPVGRVPGNTYWLVDQDRLIGASRLRHWLVPHLEQEGEHIGYGIRPSQRRQGYGHLILTLTLKKAQAMSLQRILVTCDTDNIASAHIIEHNGGVLENRVISERTGKQVSRYWITL